MPLSSYLQAPNFTNVNSSISGCSCNRVLILLFGSPKSMEPFHSNLFFLYGARTAIQCPPLKKLHVKCMYKLIRYGLSIPSVQWGMSFFLGRKLTLKERARGKHMAGRWNQKGCFKFEVSTHSLSPIYSPTPTLYSSYQFRPSLFCRSSICRQLPLYFYRN